MKGLVLTCLLLSALVIGQELPQPMQQQCGIGQWQNITQSQGNNFPRYFICGAEMNYYREVKPYGCSLSRQIESPIMIKCDGGQTLSQRSNGIKFRYCNFQNWEDQSSAQYYGSFEWLGLKMCPRDYYVNGFQTKTNDNDGLNGLIINCRPRYLSPNGLPYRVDVIVRDGTGTWSNSTTSISATNIAAYYELKISNDYITGLKLHFRPFPTIVKMVMEYDNPPAPDFTMDVFYNTIFQNKMPGAPPLDSIFNSDPAKRQKSYPLTFTNFLQSKNKYHGERFRKFTHDNYTKLQFLIPTIFSKTEAPNINVDRTLGYRLQTFSWDQFEFGKTLYRGLKLTVPPPTFTTPACTRTDVRQRVFTADIQLRYTLTITYASLTQTFTEKITGMYRGTVFSQTEIFATQFPICPP